MQHEANNPQHVATTTLDSTISAEAEASVETVGHGTGGRIGKAFEGGRLQGAQRQAYIQRLAARQGNNYVQRLVNQKKPKNELNSSQTTEIATKHVGNETNHTQIQRDPLVVPVPTGMQQPSIGALAPIPGRARELIPGALTSDITYTPHAEFRPLSSSPIIRSNDFPRSFQDITQRRAHGNIEIPAGSRGYIFLTMSVRVRPMPVVPIAPGGVRQRVEPDTETTQEFTVAWLLSSTPEGVLTINQDSPGTIAPQSNARAMYSLSSINPDSHVDENEPELNYVQVTPALTGATTSISISAVAGAARNNPPSSTSANFKLFIRVTGARTPASRSARQAVTKEALHTLRLRKTVFWAREGDADMHNTQLTDLRSWVNVLRGSSDPEHQSKLYRVIREGLVPIQIVGHASNSEHQGVYQRRGPERIHPRHSNSRNTEPSGQVGNQDISRDRAAAVAFELQGLIGSNIRTNVSGAATDPIQVGTIRPSELFALMFIDRDEAIRAVLNRFNGFQGEPNYTQ
jgi:hypothetical protein